MVKFDRARKKEGGHWHLANLPFVLYMANQGTWRDANDLAVSVLSTLDRFCLEFAATPGFRGVIQPLAKGVWKYDDPEFWSVMAHAYVTLLIRDRGFVIMAFAAQIPGGEGKDADILVGMNSERGYVDIVMKHRPKFRTADDARRELHSQAEQKIGTKFGRTVETGVKALVVVVCVPKGEQFEVLDRDPALLSGVDGEALGRSGEVSVAFMAMAGARRAGRLSWRLFSRDEWAATRQTN